MRHYNHSHKFSYVVKIRRGSGTCESSWRTNFPRGAGGGADSRRGDGVRERNRRAPRSPEPAARNRREP